MEAGIRKPPYLLLIVGVALFFGSYFSLRYLGSWVENDTTTFLVRIAEMQEAGVLAPPKAYPQGYAYQVWTLALSEITGLPLADLLLRFGPVLGCFLMAVIGFATYKTWLESRKLGLLAASLLFLIPELYFSVARGNHEKLTVSLTLFASLALVQSFRLTYVGRWKLFASWVVVFYLAVFSLVSLNAVWASSYIAALSFALLVAVLLLLFRRGAKRALRRRVGRLVLVVVSSWLLVSLMMWYLYPFSGQNIELLSTVLERLASLFLSFTPESNPYDHLGSTWVSVAIYRLLSSFRWLLFIGSFVTGLALLFRVLKRPARSSVSLVLLVAFYAAFGLQLSAAVLVDLIGLPQGSNLQVRIYTYFVLFAVPVFIIGYQHAGAFMGAIPRRIAFGILPALLAGFSLLKATNDPLVSNIWRSYSPSELTGVSFWDSNVESGELWVGPDERLVYAYAINNSTYIIGPNEQLLTGPTLDAGYALFSQTLLANSVALESPLPHALVENQVYDSGMQTIFKRLPRTPFQ